MFLPMRIFPLFPFLFSVALTEILAGCGGGSGRSGDDGQFSLSGRTAFLERKHDLVQPSIHRQ